MEEVIQQRAADIKQKTEPKDIFLHLLAIVTLYASAISFLVLIFNYVDYFIPDTLQLNYYSRESLLGSMRWAIAMIIIFFPAYILTTRYLDKIYLASPSKRNLRIRKWLIYFTLFITALIMLGDLVDLIFTFLNGDITTRFILKVLEVLFVAGSIFIYYFWDVRRVEE